jgi:hypothetical protein
MNIRAKVYGGPQSAEEPLLRAKKPKGTQSENLQTVTVPREVRRASNARGEDRHRLSGERARITHDGRELQVDLINLSGGGAMVSREFEPMLWDRVDLHLGDHGTVECAVRWIRKDRIGLEFAHETRLDWPSHNVAIVLRNVIERSFPDISFPVAEEEPPKEEEQRDLTDDHRAARRHPLIWSGTLHHDFQSDAVRIRNISETGAMVETTAKVRVGCEPFLELSPEVSMSATVEWAVGDQVGLRFHVPFDLNRLAEARPKVAQTDWKAPSYLGAAKEDRWGRLNLNELRDELEGFLKR